MAGIGAHEVIIESPNTRSAWPTCRRGQHPRGPLGLPRPPGRPEEGPPPAVHADLQERRRGGGRQARAHPLPVDRTADRADSVWEEMRAAGPTTAGRCIYCDMVQQELADGDRDRASTRPTSPRSALRAAGSRSRPGSSPRAMPATSRTSPSSSSSASRRSCGSRSRSASWRRPSTARRTTTSSTRSPFDIEETAALPLAHRDHPPADQGRRLRVGHRVLHQPRPAGRRGQIPARGATLKTFEALTVISES